MSDTYVAVHPALTNSIFYTQTTLLIETLHKAGAIICVGDELLTINPSKDDKLIVYGNVMEHIRHQLNSFKPENIWCYVVDEQSRQDAYPYVTALRHMKDVCRTKNIVVTYQNVAHLQALKSAGANYLIMPQCIKEIRPHQTKQINVLISGQLDPCFFDPTSGDRFYVTRTRMASALKREMPNEATLLQYPGMELSETWHKRVGEGYLETLDMCWLGIVCRSIHDRFVGKYVEMGACHTLPVGDCPSYMPIEMKRAMVDVEKMSDIDAVIEIRRLLKSPNEIIQRSDAYSNEVNRRYLALPNVKRLLGEIART